MKNVLVTGAKGFIGKNLVVALSRLDDLRIFSYARNDDPDKLQDALLKADIVFHLAGVNRPVNDEEFFLGNTCFTQDMVNFLQNHHKTPKIILSSSIQAALDNPYGRSKKAAEDSLIKYHEVTGAPIAIYRLPGVFGKWSRPNYNSVVATFCHNIAREMEITISDPDHEIELVYIDDVVREFLRHLHDNYGGDRKRYSVNKTFRVTLGELAERIRSLHAISQTLTVPDQSDDFTKYLYATYLSFLPKDHFTHTVKKFSDQRGWLFELIKSENFGQIFVSKTLPGITRGNHYHDTKLEKFCVIQGEGIIRFKKVGDDEVIEYPVNGTEIKIVDIPPGYSHSIQNTGNIDMICLFWANQIFDPDHPDTYGEPVMPSTPV